MYSGLICKARKGDTAVRLPNLTRNSCMKLSALLLCGIIAAAATLGAANEALKPGPVQPADIEQSILQPEDTAADPQPLIESDSSRTEASERQLASIRTAAVSKWIQFN
jgi:hypothetical protein